MLRRVVVGKVGAQVKDLRCRPGTAVLACALLAAWMTGTLRLARCATDSQPLRVNAHIGPRRGPGQGGQVGGPALPERVVVSDGVVRVGDLLTPGGTAGLSQEELQRVVISGLRPGETRALTTCEIALRLAQVGIPVGQVGGPAVRSGGAVLIERAAQVVSAAALVAAGAEAIKEQLGLTLQPGSGLASGEEPIITVVAEPRPLLAPVGPLSLEATARRPVLRGGLWVVEVAGRVVGGEGPAAGGGREVKVEPEPRGEVAFTCTLRYRLRVMGAVLVTRRPVRWHEKLSASDVAPERRELTTLPGAPLTTVADLVGRRAARAVSAGTVLTTDWLEAIPAVGRGDVIRAVARCGLVRVSAQLVACANGHVGDRIAARSPDEGAGGSAGPRPAVRTEVQVLVTGPGQGEVMVGP